MKIRKLTPVIAAIAAVSMLAVSANAYDLDKDLGTGWSKNATVPASEFAELTDTSVITITYTADASLADVEGQSYWVIKPMVNDAGWPLVEGISQLTPSEDSSSYVVDVDGTSISFTVPADFVEPIKTAGVAFMGHGITLGTLTVSNDAVIPAETDASDAPAADKGNADTGVEGVAAIAGIAILAASAAIISSKRKNKVS